MKKMILTVGNVTVEATGLNAKDIHVYIQATHPEDGKVRLKYVGWLSTTNTLHSNAKCPKYALEQAGKTLSGMDSKFEAFFKEVAEAWDIPNKKSVEYTLNLRLSHLNRMTEEKGEGAFMKRLHHHQFGQTWVGKERIFKL